MGELTITPANKEPLSKGNSVVVDSMIVDKSVATGRKLKIIKAGAIMTTSPVDILATIDMATVKDTIEVVASLAGIANFIEKKMNQKKNDHDKVDVVKEGIEIENIKVKGKTEGKHSTKKRKPKSAL